MLALTLGTSVGATPGEGDAPDDTAAVYAWDWSATTHEPKGEFVNDLVVALGAVNVLPGKGYQGWSQSVDCYDNDGYKVGSVFFGGGRKDVHVRSTSEVADKVRTKVATIDGARTARVDTRVDTDRVGFSELAEILEDAADRYGSEVTYYEKFKHRESQGRTVYLGAPSSAIRVRLYEKWLESPGEYAEGTNRVEVQLRPPSRVKDRVSSWTRAETFCASKVTQHLAASLGADLVPAASLHLRRPTPDLERTLRAMGEQYGPSVERFLALGGDGNRVVDYLLGAVELEAVNHSA